MFLINLIQMTFFGSLPNRIGRTVYSTKIVFNFELEKIINKRYNTYFLFLNTKKNTTLHINFSNVYIQLSIKYHKF